MKKGLLNLAKQVLKSGVQVLDDVSRRQDMNVAMKRRAVGGAKKMDEKSMDRAPARKNVSRKQTVKGSRTTTKKRKEHRQISFVNESEQSGRM